MRLLLNATLLIGTIVGFSSGKSCPILGPVYPAVIDTASSLEFNAAKTAFTETITRALSTGQLDGRATSFSIQVFSSRSGDPIIYEYYHTASDTVGGLLRNNNTVGPQTVYRIGSISKLVSVYAILSRLSDRYWNHPVTDFLPELARIQPRNDVDSVEWSQVTLGALASQMAGIGRDCMYEEITGVARGSWARYVNYHIDALGDLSAAGPTVPPGLPILNESRIVHCGAPGVTPPCTRAGRLRNVYERF